MFLRSSPQEELIDVKTVHMCTLVIMVALLFVACPVQAAADMNGPHYNLNVIGVQKDKVKDVSAWYNGDRHTMFVPLQRKVNIYMTQSTVAGDDFAVLDANGCDNNGASFQLAPGYYEVYARAVGIPGGDVTITPNASFDADASTSDFYLGSITVGHTKKPSWERVTGLFIADVYLFNDGVLTGSYSNAWIFDIPELLSYWWEYDNHGCKVLQVRFYPVDEQPVVPNL